MKKTYNKPETRIHKIKLNHLCTLSLDPNTKAGSSTTVLSRRNNDWDWGDDDE